MNIEAHQSNQASPAHAGEAVSSTQAQPQVSPLVQAPVPQAQPRGEFQPPAPQAAQTPQSRKLSADDDTIPDDADMFEISKSALKKRLDRAKRSDLMKTFGTDNVEDILAWKQQAEDAAKREEEQRLAQMTDAERYRAQYEKAYNDSMHWKTEFERLQESYAVREQDQQMTNVASKYVHPKLMNSLMFEFATHLQNADDEVIGENPAAYAENWFKNYVAENPEFGVPKTPAAPEAQQFQPQIQQVAPAPKQVQVPISNGAVGGKPQNAMPTGQMTQKTLAPNQPNSMSADEAKRWMRSHGYNF